MQYSTVKNKRRFKFAFTSIFLFLLHLPFVFAKSRPGSSATASVHTLENMSNTKPEYIGINPVYTKVYDSLKLQAMGLSKQAFDYCIKGYQYLANAGKLANEKIISIVDFSKSSSQKRLFILDIKNYRLLFQTHVAHGMNSGLEYATQFSNIPESNMSSLGFYKTGATYMGANGYSLKLAGLEKGINDNALQRDIVMHGADYVSQDYIDAQGYIGRSWGCPAVSQKLSKNIIDKIKNGTCLFIYSPDKNYIKRSAII